MKYKQIRRVGIDLDNRMIDYVNQHFKETLKPQESERFNAKQFNFCAIDKIFPFQSFPEEFVRGEKFDCVFADLGYNS